MEKDNGQYKLNLNEFFVYLINCFVSFHLSQVFFFIIVGDALSNHILEVINENSLGPGHLISQSYDCTKSMIGYFQGIQAQISKKLERGIIYVPGTAHRSTTSLKIACEASLDVKHIVDVLQTVFRVFTCNTKK